MRRKRGGVHIRPCEQAVRACLKLVAELIRRHEHVVQGRIANRINDHLARLRTQRKGVRRDKERED